MVAVGFTFMKITVANGPAIRRARELAGMSQRDLARAVGVTESAMSQVEAGGGMRPRNLKLAAEVIQVPVAMLTHEVNRPADVCAVLGIDREEYDRLAKTGELSVIGGGVTDSDLEEYIARRLPEMAAS
jgi:transcriptional regulator with XRE-family HTH domain